MTHPFDEIAVEAAARASWEAETSAAPEFRDGIWNKTHDAWECFLPDDDVSLEDIGSLQNPTGRSTYMTMARAALSAAFKSATERGMAFEVQYQDDAHPFRPLPNSPVTIIRHKEPT